jgi:hypothetical protein
LFLCFPPAIDFREEFIDWIILDCESCVLINAGVNRVQSRVHVGSGIFRGFMSPKQIPGRIAGAHVLDHDLKRLAPGSALQAGAP